MIKQISAAIKNANVVSENGIIWDGVILLSEERIVAAGKASEIDIPQSTFVIDAKGSYVGPGFVDIHVHGGNGHSACFDTDAAAKYFMQHGTTSFLASPSGRESLTDAIKAVKKAVKTNSMVKGMYVEGPYINPNYGAFAKQKPWCDNINEDDYKAVIDESGNLVKVWTVAPEREGIISFMEYARKVNPDVIFAVGHSEATPMEIRKLGKYRPRILTHAMDATGRKKVPGGTRGYGPDEYCFNEPDMYAELISDSCGVHVHSELQQLIIHNKGIHHTLLITDGTIHNNPTPEHLKHVTDLNFTPTGGIAGSKLTMDVACRNIMTHTNCGIAQAFLMASTNPARAIRMDNEIGTIEEGKIADLIFVDDKFNVKQVMLRGKMQEI